MAHRRVRREEQCSEPAHNYREDVRRYYATHPGCQQKECAEALGCSRTTVKRHIEALRAEWAMQGERDAA